MASSRSVTASLQRTLVRRNPIRVATQVSRRCLQTNSILTRPRIGLKCLPQDRAFSVSVPRRLADFNDGFDPKSIDRESDEVDVCIIGGGKLVWHVHEASIDIPRSCWIKCGNS